jgi:GT2 family glycosyltransferase
MTEVRTARASHVLTYRLILFASKAAMLFSRRTGEKMARSAQKRHPYLRTYGRHAFEYSSIISAWETQRASLEPRYRNLAEALKGGPLISVIMPVHNPDPELLAKTIRSVQNQRYENWELCIAEDASPNPKVREVLAQAASSEPRIKVEFRRENGHISQASNSALSLASGRFAALLDDDDLLDRDALLLVAEAIGNKPDVKIIYTDEDKINADGARYEPHFKSGWNREMLYAMNYVSHLGIYDLDLVRAVGGFRPGLEGAQDHDLLLRCVARVSDRQIHHIPKVLYHWRASPGSVAESNSNKSYATEAGIRALADHLEDVTGKVIPVRQGPFPFSYEPDWPVDDKPLVSIIIPTRDRLDLVRTAVESILEKTDYPHFEILVVDNASVETRTLQWFGQISAQDSRVRILRDERAFNYSALNNAAVLNAKGTVLALVNNDVEVISPGWLGEMVSLAIRPDVGCVGAKLYYPDRRIQHAGVVVGVLGGAAHLHQHRGFDDPGYFQLLKVRREVMAVTGACLVVRRKVFEEAGGLNEADLAVAFNDIDLCLKVHAAGYRNVWTHKAELVHFESASRGHENTPEKKQRFDREVDYMTRTWRFDVLQDPFYNPNFSRQSTDFTFGLPEWRFP